MGDIPILGKFFQSISKNKTNTELFVIVTPEVVDPIPAGESLPQLKFPAAFLPSNSGIPMNTPETKPAGAPQVHPPTTMPVEQLIQSMQPEKPLVIDSTSSGAFGSSGSGSGSSSTPAPPQ
jgi:pilus assembly protein CpaC